MRNRFKRRNKSKCNAKKTHSKEEENIKSLALSPFIPGNKRLLNEENDNNPGTTDTPKSKKYDMSHTSRDDSFEIAKDTKNDIDDEK